MNRSAKIVLVLMLSCIVFGIVLIWWLRSAMSEPVPVSPEMQQSLNRIEYPFTTLEGQATELQAATTTFSLISTWASWCPDCEEQLITMQAIAESEPMAADISFFAINRAESAWFIDEYMATTFPIIISDRITLLTDDDDFWYDDLDGQTMPETVLLNASGTVLQHWRGLVASTTIHEALNEQVAVEE